MISAESENGIWIALQKNIFISILSYYLHLFDINPSTNIVCFKAYILRNVDSFTFQTRTSNLPV